MAASSALWACQLSSPVPLLEVAVHDLLLCVGGSAGGVIVLFGIVLGH